MSFNTENHEEMLEFKEICLTNIFFPVNEVKFIKNLKISLTS